MKSNLASAIVHVQQPSGTPAAFAEAGSSDNAGHASVQQGRLEEVLMGSQLNQASNSRLPFRAATYLPTANSAMQGEHHLLKDCVPLVVFVMSSIHCVLHMHSRL